MFSIQAFTLFSLIGLQLLSTGAEGSQKNTAIYPSVVCQEKTNPLGPTCCLENASQCETAVKNLPQMLKDSEELVRTKYFQGQFAFGSVPNCHWNTYSFLTSQMPPLEPLADYKLWDLMMASTQEVALNEVRAGDIIGFFFRGKERVEPDRPGGPWKWEEVPETLEHSAVAVSETLIFQKENVGSHVFSLAGIEQTRKAYEADFLKASRRHRGEFIAKVFRPLTQ